MELYVLPCAVPEDTPEVQRSPLPSSPSLRSAWGRQPPAGRPTGGSVEKALEGAEGTWQTATVSALRLAHQAHQQLEEREARTSIELRRALEELAEAKLAEERALELWRQAACERGEGAGRERRLAERLAQVEADLAAATARCQSLSADADRAAHRARRAAEELEGARAEHAREVTRFAQARDAKVLREQALREELEEARRTCAALSWPEEGGELAPALEFHGPVCQHCVWCRPEDRGGPDEWWVQADGDRMLLRAVQGRPSGPGGEVVVSPRRSAELAGELEKCAELLRELGGELAEERRRAGELERQLAEAATSRGISRSGNLAGELEEQRSQKCAEILRELEAQRQAGRELEKQLAEERRKSKCCCCVQ